MKWESIALSGSSVVTNNGETLKPLSSFACKDGDNVILQAHFVEDGDNLCLLTEHEDPTGKRLVARTTQWPKAIMLLEATPAFLKALGVPYSDPEAPAAKSIDDLKKELEEGKGEQTPPPPPPPPTGDDGKPSDPPASETSETGTAAPSSETPTPPAESPLEQPDAPTTSLEQPEAIPGVHY